MAHQIRGCSVLAPFRPGHDARPALDEAAALGFNLARVFCGPLPWAGQTVASVYDGLPRFLEEAGARGLNAYLSYCTEAGSGYDLAAHVGAVEAIAAAFPRVVLREVANEPDHPTQGGRLSPEVCRDLAARLPGPVALGATIADDESPAYAGAGGAFGAVHLDRGRDAWNMVRRVREMLALGELIGKPILNQEPIGAAEASIPGKRESDPAIFFTMGVLDRLFLGGSGIFHSDDGLWAQPLGRNQKACALAFLAGTAIWPGADRLRYLNTGHAGSPVAKANFDRVCRVYSGVTGGTGITVALGLAGGVEAAGIVWGDGWRPAEVLASRAGVTVWRVVQ